MNKREQQNAARIKGIEMLKQYLHDDGSKLYGLQTGHGLHREAVTGTYECLVVSYGRIVNVSLYVANAIGCRRNKLGAVIGHRTWQDVAEAVASALGVKTIPFEKL